MLRKCFLSKVTLLAVLLVSALSLNGQSVSPSGAFTYEYPIEIPKGTNGMQPSISLAYNSQAGNGIAGMGWSLTGFPTIARDTSYPINWNNEDHFVYNGQRLIKDSQNTLLYHTEAESFQKIEYVNNDHWVVSLKNGTKMYYGATSDSKIEAIGKNAPLLWSLNKVIDVNGNYYTVVYEEDAANGDYYPKSIKYTQNDNGLISAYKEILFDYDLTRQDKYITYNPSQMEMNQRLKRITVNINNSLYKKYELTYDQPAGLQDVSKIIFIMELGSDGHTVVNETELKWEGPGQSFTNYKTLASYDPTSYNRDYAKYFPGDYNGDGKQDLLSLYTVGGNNNIYCWYGTDTGLSSNKLILSFPSLSFNLDYVNNHFYSGDYNGDGKSDLLAFYKVGGYSTLYCWYGTDTGLTSAKALASYSPTSYNRDYAKYFPGDYNGDGKTDLLSLYTVGGNNNIYCWYGTDTGLSSNKLILSFPSSSFNLDYVNNHFYSGDYNGDGKSDLLAFYKVGGYSTLYCWYGTDTGLSSAKALASYSPTSYNRDYAKYFPGDYNGDGKTDLLSLYTVGGNNNIYCWYGTDTGLSSDKLILSFPSSSFNLDYVNNHFYSGDYNGDSKSDLLAFYKVGGYSTLYCWYGTDTGLSSAKALASYSPTSYNRDYAEYFPGDFIGDGRTDLLGFYKVNGYSTIFGWLSPKMAPNVLKSLTTATGATITPTYAPAPQVSGAVNPVDSTYPNVANKSPRNVVTSLTISEGHDANKTYTSTYEYFNGKYRSGAKEDRKQLGFEWTIKRNPDGTYVKTYYHQEGDQNGGTSGVLAGLIKRTEKYGKDGLIYSAKEFEYFSRPVQAENGNYKAVNFKYKSKELEYHFNGVAYTTWEELKALSDLEVLKTSKSYTYDTDGNLIQVYDEGDTSTKADDKITDSLYTSGDLVVPYSVKEYKYPLGTTVFGVLTSPDNLAKHNELYYDGSSILGFVGTKGHVTKKVEYSGEVDQTKYPDKITSYTFDHLGNIKTITNGYGGTTTLNYEEKFHVNIKSKVNALDQVVDEFGFDSLDRVIWKKDINNQYYWYKYDSKNREVELAKGDSIGPVRVLSRTTYSDITSPHDYPRWIKKETYSPSLQNTENYNISYAYIDNFGNQLQSKTQGINDLGNSTWITISFFEDPITWITKTSEPYEEATSAYSDVNNINWDNLTFRHTTEYKDSIGRQFKTIRADGFEEYKKYGIRKKFSLSVDNTGLASLTYEEVKDNNLIKYSYPKGTYTYVGLDTFDTSSWNYRVETENKWNGTSLNEISKSDFLSNNPGNTLTTKVDALGRKKYYSDPNMGKWFYEYDLNGNIKGKTDANGYTTYFEYDKLNRVSKKIGANTTIYLYDGKTATGGIDLVKYGPDYLGQLTELYYEDGSYSESYYYDNANKEYKITKTIDGITRTVATTLDDLGRKVSEDLPDNEIVAYHYKNDGNLKSIKSNTGTTYVNNFQYTIVGKVKSYESGNSSTTKYTYNENNQLVALDINDYLPAPIALMTFSYDGFGNINYKTFTDGNLQFDETYTYDAFSRLEKAVSTANLYGTKDYVYDNYNNIVSKNGLTYKYNQIDGKPHAVSEIEDGLGNVVKTYKYDKNGNVVKITGQSHLLVSAKAVSLSNPPIMELRLDGKLKKTWIVTSTSYQDYSWDGVVPQGSTIDIVLNEKSSSNPNTMIPMSDLYVDYININGSIVHSESTDVVLDSGATVSECFDNLNVTPGQELISSLSALRYEIPAIAKNPVRDMYYNADNKLISIWDNSVMTSSFKYDDAGQRIKKTEGNITIYYFFDSYEEEYVTENNVETLQKSVKFYFANDQRVAYRETNSLNESKVYYYHTDHLGSAVRITDETGKIIQSIAYTPFGEVAWFSGEDSTNYTYTGQESDGSGFMYYNARYYDPELGRFLQSDPYLDGVNRYTYCGNNPVMYTDPTGNWVAIAIKVVCVAYGIYSGGRIANGGEVNPMKWDWEDPMTYIYMAAGGVAGYLQAETLIASFAVPPEASGSEDPRVKDKQEEEEAEYNEALKQNAMPTGADGEEIENISKYIMYDENGEPYTNKNGGAIFNEEGQEYLHGNNWRIEDLDVYHEENGKAVVKIVNIVEGYEQVYDMRSGKLITDPRYAGTYNRTSGPYGITNISNSIGHYKNDVVTWIKFGGGYGDTSTVSSRRALFIWSLLPGNGYGSDYRNEIK